MVEGRATGVTTTKTAFHAAKVVNCAGAWSGQIAPHAFPTRPVKGQMLCLLMPSRTLLKHVIRSPQAYLIPRSDGRLLVGATVEEAGFDKRTDLATIQRFHRAALELVPELRNGKILESWAGLRPGTPDAPAHSRRDCNSRLLRRHRPLPRRNSARAHHRGSHGRSDRRPRAGITTWPRSLPHDFNRSFLRVASCPS